MSTADAAPDGPGPRLGRLHVLVDSLIVAEAALEAGAPTLQVRLKTGTDARPLPAWPRAIAERCRAAGATCLVNDRADLAVAVEADGVHVGADDLPVRAVRRIVGPDALVGGTARDPVTARRLVDEGASATWASGRPSPPRRRPACPTRSASRAWRRWPTRSTCRSSPSPASPRRPVEEVLATGAWGVAVIGAVADAPDPHVATHDLMVAVAKAVDASGGAGGDARP